MNKENDNNSLNTNFDLGRTIELTWFNTILNFSQIINQERKDKKLIEIEDRLSNVETDLKIIIKLLEHEKNGE